MSLFNRAPKPRLLPPFETDPKLVLKAPEHYHVSGIVYDGLAKDGMTFTWSAAFNDLIGNDMLAVAEMARRRAHKAYAHISSWRVCKERHPDPK